MLFPDSRENYAPIDKFPTQMFDEDTVMEPFDSTIQDNSLLSSRFGVEETESSLDRGWIFFLQGRSLQIYAITLRIMLNFFSNMFKTLVLPSTLPKTRLWPPLQSRMHWVQMIQHTKMIICPQIRTPLGHF